MQFTKEVIALTPKVNEAIKKIAGKMERRCRRCEGIGYKKGNPTHKCSACNGTGKVKGKWEWKPEVGECFSFGWKDIRKLIIIPVKFYLEEDNICFDDYVFPISHCIPLLHWERIEEILEGMEYRIYTEKFYMDSQLKSRKSAECKIYQYDQHLQGGTLLVKLEAKTRQEAVQQAVIELGKELNYEPH